MPKTMMMNDYDLIREIFLVATNTRMTVSFNHVEGYQDTDKTPISKLPLKARLNIECDKRARMALKVLPIGKKANPMLPSSYPHLTIARKMICCQYTNNLRAASCTPKHHQYLTRKFHWDPKAVKSIDWRIVVLATCHFTLPDQTQIHKMIHKWLPKKLSPGNAPTVKLDKLCPSCK